jgi:tyrosyl-tRNA synthetase
VTTLVHGAGEYEKVAAASRALFGQGDLGALDETTLTAALAEVPSTVVQLAGNGSAGAGSSLAEAEIPPVSELMARAGIVASRSAARRAITQGGAYLNNRKVTNETDIPTTDDLLHGKFLVLRRGKHTVGGVEVLVPGPAETRRSI